MKKELKDWQKDFTTRVGRTPTDADKSAIEDRFLFYQKVRTVSSLDAVKPTYTVG
jgi:hypothetical protein